MRPHEQQIVRRLADTVRVLSLTQAARTWWSESRWGQTRAKASLASLADGGWLTMQRVLSRPIVNMETPLVDWKRGDRQPDFKVIAKALHRRAMADSKLTTVVFATRRAVALFGTGPLPTIKLTQMTHDLNVSELFLHYHRQGLPAGEWLSEDRLPCDWPIQQRPDAVLRDENGNYKRAVEYGGDYPVSRLAELHTGFSRIGLDYEIW